MSVILFKTFVLICGFGSRFQAVEFLSNQTVQSQNEVLPGSDVCLHCDVSFLSESSTLQWETDGAPTSNTTLIYNNSAYIILHTVNENNTGEYHCRLTEDGRTQTVKNHKLTVKTYSYNGDIKKNNTIYRESSRKSGVLLICKTSRTYQKWSWTWEKSSNSQIDLITVEKGGKVKVKGPIKSGRFSSTTYDSKAFILHISPVHFNYSGTYRCITGKGTYTTTILHTIRVSVKPPNGVLRNQSVVLTCELSEVTESVTLVWLRMERNRGVLEKQNTMTEKNNKLQLTVNLSSYRTEPLHWQCAVFTENQLRALAPVIISFTSETTDAPTISTNNSTVSNRANYTMTVSSVLILLGILLGAFSYYCYRKQMSVQADAEESEAVYINISEMRNDRAYRRSTLGIREKSPETSQHTRTYSHEITNMNLRNETPPTDSVTYTTVYFNKFRVRT